MDDDVKNLFEKFGQTNQAYQEINRDLESDQARGRWPLLRDVQVSTHAESATAPLSQDKPMPLLRPSAVPTRKPVLKQAFTAPTSELDTTVPEGGAVFNAAESTPQPGVQAKPESHTSNVVFSTLQNGSASRFTRSEHGKLSDSMFAQSVQESSDSLFSRRQETAQQFGHSIQDSGNTHVAASNSKSVNAPHLFQQHNRATEPTANNPKSVNAIFDRLARKSEVEKPVSNGTQSFFKRIFRS